jgi:hypothetical protein
MRSMTGGVFGAEFPLRVAMLGTSPKKGRIKKCL